MTPRRLALVVVLGGLSAFGPLSIDMYLPSLPHLAHGFDAPASEVQLTLTACLVGLALGQLVVGSLSDRLGRRRPLLGGLAVYVAASLACAAAPGVHALVGFRLLQGAAGAAGIVVARAVVRDLWSGRELARTFALLMLVTGVAPILAPILGAQILRVSSWRGVFVVLAIVGAVLLAAAAAVVRETLPPERRHGGGPDELRATMADLVGDRVFVGYLITLGLAFGSMFAYIAGSPFVLQDVHDVSAQEYAAVFGANALGLVAAGQASARLVGRVGPRRLLSLGVTASAVGALAFLAVTATGGGLAAIVPALFVLVASLGFVLPNATALALADHPSVAGSASGLIGIFQFVIGAVAAPLVGLAGTRSAWPMAVVVATLSLGAVAALHGLARPRELHSGEWAGSS